MRLPALPGLLVPAIAWLLSGCSQPDDGRARSVLLLSIDTLRADRLGCTGDPAARTPAWDRLARRGTQFRTALAPAPFTLPSHSTMMTGEYPYEHLARYNSMRTFAPGAPTLAEILGEHRRRTAAFTATIILDDETGLERGFDTWEYRDREGQLDRRADAVVRSATRWARELPAGQPYFLFVHCYDAHEPYEPPEPWARLFADDPYRGEIAFVDRQVGRLLQDLEADDRLERTLVVAVSDHGEEFGEHGANGHGFYVYENTLRVPLAFAGTPAFDGAALRDDPARLLDLYPTILRAAGIASDREGEGRPLQDRLAPGRRVESYAETWWAALEFDASDLRTLREGDWKYIRAPREELYDLAADPTEQRNLFETEADRAADLRDRLLARLGDDVDRPAGFDRAEAPGVERREDLAALGYVGGGPLAAGRDFHRLVDPKDMAGFPAMIDELGELTRAARWAEIPPLADRVLALHPVNPTAIRTKARAAFRTGRIDEGLAVYAGVLEAHPSEAPLWRDYGTALLRHERFDEARRAFRKAVQIDPGNLDARFDFVVAAVRSNRPHVARNELREILAIDPNHEAAARMAREMDREEAAR